MRLLLLALLLVRTANSCECQTSFRPCNEVVASDLVFIGRVESITPIFLNRWNVANHAALQSLNDAYIEAEKQPSDAALAHLKDTYRKSFPDLAPDTLHELQSARTVVDVTSIFYTTLNRGRG